MWKDTNYGAQVEQMKLAGINPALLYGKGGGGGQTASANVSGVAGGQASSSKGEILQGIGLMQQQQQMRLQEAQIENMNADTEKKKVEANKTGGVDTDKTKAEIASITQGVENQKAQEILTKLQARLTEINGDSAELQYIFDNETFDYRASQLENNARQSKWLADKAESESIQAGVSKDIAVATKQKQIDIIGNVYTKGVLENELLRLEKEYVKAQTTNVEQATEESKGRIKKMESDIAVNSKQIWKMGQDVLQGWAGLGQKERELKIKEFEAETRRLFPSIQEVMGKTANRVSNMSENILIKVGEFMGIDVKGFRDDKVNK
jgi:hypothetical protein